ncbi:Dyp-type peroxidase [Microbacterium sp. SS28]|uniref:Dyp-type peroxidase n=1 Tax=Microbacterium sp. SS28 TaxID=2919948 RepID=UPI001FA94901|nr:Dyp-type peroxidase [Microbacterium sp. SS28]
MSGEGLHALANLMPEAVPRLSGIELPSATAVAGGDVERHLLGDEPATDEPLFDAAVTADVQGNVVPGFNKDHQRFLFLVIDDVTRARAWLQWLAPRLSSMQEVLDFRREFRRERLLTGAADPSAKATWTAFALSRSGVVTLLGEDALEQLGDEAFRQGMAERSTYLGDPATPGTSGHRGAWRVGGEDCQADFLVTVAADSADDAAEEAAAIIEVAARSGVRLLFEQTCANLPGTLAGHEHFGFKDGVSQPGIRGVTADGEYLAPRYVDPRNPHARIFGKAGQPLVWPGQFVLGMPRQNPADPQVPATDEGRFPDWARHGSYLVCRRLDQDVPAFWDFAAAGAEAHGTTPVHFASMLVGRWPSGAPISRAPEEDDLPLAGDEFANNHFLFDDDTGGWAPTTALSEGGYAGDGHPKAKSDLFGQVCPMAGHIRKVNPRDSGTDFGAPADTFLRLMLRRGIPYGPPLAGVPDPAPELVAAERGLMFVAHMASIEDQFEFVTRRWANSPLQPNAGGHDPIIGQSDVYGDRERTIELRGANGERTTYTLDRAFVTASGGGYFFAPPISAVGGHLATTPEVDTAPEATETPEN